MKTPKGFIIDRGLSPINGQPYVAILTLKSTNRKTGNMAQVWILCEDVNPVDAVQTGKDVSICGDCPHRRKYVYDAQRDEYKWVRSCYVNVGQGPNSIYKAYKRGAYVDSTSWDLKKYASIIGKRRIRWGAYGDPSVIKPGIVIALSAYAMGHTGYTHQWRKEFASPFKGIFQASCDGFNDYLEATAHGWKTFTVVNKNATINYAKQCPATVQNSVAQCQTCKLCDGAKSDIFVHAHGTGSKYVTAA
jgi:hypothetical protein